MDEMRVTVQKAPVAHVFVPERRQKSRRQQFAAVRVSFVEARYPSGAFHGIREEPPQEPVLRRVRVAVLDAGKSLQDGLQLPRMTVDDGEHWRKNLACCLW